MRTIKAVPLKNIFSGEKYQFRIAQPVKRIGEKYLQIQAVFIVFINITANLINAVT